MGQGFYVMYGYGCMMKQGSDLLSAYGDGDAILEKLLEGYKTAYECDVDYIVKPLADCGQGYLSDEPVISQTAYSAKNAENVLIDTLKKDGQLKLLEDAIKEWKELQAKCKELGYTLPDGEILVIHDYD